MAAAETSNARSAQAVEVEAFAGLFGAEDTREGLEAFLEKRPAEFKGR
jgi:enoyl-CoA hydratase/carnithine racemase